MNLMKERQDFFRYMNKVGAIPFYCISLIAFFIIEPNEEGHLGHIFEAGFAPFFMFPTLNVMLLVNPVLMMFGRSPLGDLYYELMYFGSHGDIPTAQHYIAVPFFLLMVVISKIPLPVSLKFLFYMMNSLFFVTMAPSTWSHLMVIIAMVWIYFFCELKHREGFGMRICDSDTQEEASIDVVFARNIYKLISFSLIPLTLLFYLKNSVSPWDYYANTEIVTMGTSEVETNSNVKKILKTKVNVVHIIGMVVILYSIFLQILHFLENQGLV